VITLPSSVQNLSLTFDSRSESLELVASSYNRQQFTSASSAVRGIPPPSKSEAQPRKALDALAHAAGGDGACRSPPEPDTLISQRDCLPGSTQNHQEAKSAPQTNPADHDKGRPKFCERVGTYTFKVAVPICFTKVENQSLFSIHTLAPSNYPPPPFPITYYWTVSLILDHSYLVGNLTNSKIVETKPLEPLKS
jgi:hypothetical protein